MNTSDVTRIAKDVAQQESPSLHVVGVMVSEGGGDYVEVILRIHGCQEEPCQVAIGLFRNVEEAVLRAEIEDKLRRHLAEHPG